MGVNKGKTIVAGIVIAGLLGSNAYAFMELDKAKNENNEEAQAFKEKQEQFDMAYSQLMSKSSQYASHEDMIYAFNIHSASNRINFEGKDYYVDIKEVLSHAFDVNKEVKYEAQAEMTFLQDKSVDGVSYIQNKLPAIVMEETQKLANTSHSDDHKGETDEEHASHSEESDNHEEHSDVVITQDKTTEVEKKLKEEFVVHSWKGKLTFNMDSQYIILPTSEMEESIKKEFIKAVVLKEKGISGKNAEVRIDNLETLQLITVKAEGQTFEFKYNKDTKELKEQK